MRAYPRFFICPRVPAWQRCSVPQPPGSGSNLRIGNSSTSQHAASICHPEGVSFDDSMMMLFLTTCCGRGPGVPVVMSSERFRPRIRLERTALARRCWFQRPTRAVRTSGGRSILGDWRSPLAVAEDGGTRCLVRTPQPPDTSDPNLPAVVDSAPRALVNSIPNHPPRGRIEFIKVRPCLQIRLLELPMPKISLTWIHRPRPSRRPPPDGFGATSIDPFDRRADTLPSPILTRH